MTGHAREACNHWKHTDFNHRGSWIKSEGYRKRKALLESRGESDRPVVLKRNEYASGAYIKGARFPEDKAKADRSGEITRPPDDRSARRNRTRGRIEVDTHTVWPERVPPRSTAIRNSIAEWSSKKSASVIPEEVNISN